MACNSRDATVYRLYSGCLLQMRRPRDAMPAVRRALELDPEDPDNFHSLALISQDLNRYQEAEAAFIQAIQRAPYWAHYHSNYARLLCVRGDYERAIEEAREAVRLDPGMAHAFEMLSWAEMQLGHWESARVHCLEGLRLEPESAHGHNNLGVWHMAHGDAEGAHREFAEALRILPGMKVAQDNAIRSLQARHPLFALAWKFSAALLHLPSRWREFALLCCMLVAWVAGELTSWLIGGSAGELIGSAVTLVLVLVLLFLLRGQRLFVWLMRKGIV